jgi:hypothetical protein
MKLFSNSYLNNYDILKNAVIGFELEFYSKHNYPITLEIFNRELGDIKVWGFKQYHSTFKPDEKNFKLEPDLSGGFSMAELVTGPMNYVNARLVLVKCLTILQKIATTTDRSSIHVNISFPNDSGKNIEKLNILKMILNLEETKIYDIFPDRKDNVYAKSIKNIIPYKDYDYTNSTANVLGNSLLLPNTKYYGVNFATMGQGRLEFRYMGGENYQFKVNEILDLIDYFIMTCWECIGESLDDKESKMLRGYLDENIRKYKALNKLDSFMSQFPSVEIQIDKKNDYEIVSAYYSMLYDDIYELITHSKNLRNAIINYDTETKCIEIVNAEGIKFSGPVSNLTFINCVMEQGDFTDCVFIRCQIKNSIFISCNLEDSYSEESKLLTCKVDSNSEIKDCYFTDGIMNGNMIGGVFRSGKVGENGSISKETKILNDEQNFFNIKKSEGGINKKGFKKK